MFVFRVIAAVLTLKVPTGCATAARAEQIVLRPYGDETTVNVQQMCTPIMGQAVALKLLTNHYEENQAESHIIDGVCTHAALGQFADYMDTRKLVLGVGTSILDGKKCRRKIAENSNDTLFGQSSRQYYSSNCRKDIIVLPEAQPGEGNMLDRVT